MAIIKKDGNFMGLPMNVARGNPIPLDKSEIWYSYEEMAAYAMSDPIAYVGQILGFVDEANNIAKAYIILNTDGELQEIATSATIPSLYGDNATITITDDIVALKDWGIQYYKYIPSSGTEGEEDYVEARYELQVVDETHPWVIGLEPRVTFEKGQLVLGWFEQNPTTIEGINAQISSIQTSVNELQEETGKLIAAVGHPAEGDTPATGIYADFYNKTETDSRIARAVADAAHLKRIEVDSIDDINVDAENADQFIYMVPSGLQEDDNKFYEYIVISKTVIDEITGAEVTEKTIERVGSWEVDLSDYAKKTDLNNYVKTEVLDDYVKSEILEDYAKSEDLTGYVKTEDLEEYVKAEELTEYENYITSVDENNFQVINKQLKLVKVSQDQVTGLNDVLADKVGSVEFAVVTNKVTDLDKALNGYVNEEGEAVEGLTSVVSKLNFQLQDKADTKDLIATNTTVKNLENLLNGYTDDDGTEIAGLVSVVANTATRVETLEQTITDLDDSYVSITNFNKVVGNLNTLLENEFNVYEAIEDINDRLTWQELTINIV